MLAPLPTTLTALLLAALVRAQGSPKDYAPQTAVKCPDTSKTPLIRQFTPQTQALNADEAAYIHDREANVIPGAYKDWVGDGSALGYTLSDFANFSRVGIAISGGGYRAAQYGAGVLSGLDARNDSAKAAGTGGLLQVTSYLSALSGGSWLTGSLFMNNWPTITDMVYGNGQNLSGWLLDLDLATPDGINLFDDNNQHFYGSLLWSVTAKADAGVDTSITDPWGRMISYHFLNQTSRGNFFTNDTGHGAGQLWSQIPNEPAWEQRQTPFPLICADSRPGQMNYTTALPPGPTVYEITPFEFGSWDPDLSAMTNLSYTGTHLNNGQPDNSSSCVTGFDEAGFVMGTSASLFNQILDFTHNALAGFRNQDGAGLLYVLSRQLAQVRTRADDVANWPNPFNGIKNDTYEDSGERWLNLIDGSSNGENVPLGTQFVRARALDVIVAVDGSADQDVINWPNGSSILFSAARMSSLLQTSHQQFPPLPPTPQDFISQGINMRPTFFGCFPTNTTSPEFPMVLWFPNSPPIDGTDPVANSDTFKLSYTNIFTQRFLDSTHANVLGGFVPGKLGADPNFGKCVQCAALDRARTKGGKNITRSALCETCFSQYCWDPNNLTKQSDLPGRKLNNVDPDPQGASKVEDFLAHEKGPLIGGIVGLLVLVGGLVGGLIWWKKRRAQHEYRRVSALHADDGAPWTQYTLTSTREAQRFSEISTPSYEMHDK